MWYTSEVRRVGCLGVIVCLATMGCGRFNFDDQPLLQSDADVDSSVTADAGSPREDAGEVDSQVAPPTDAGRGAIAVDNLRVEWTTPNTIRWRWDRTGQESEFDAFELWVATSTSELATTEAARVIAADENPELDVWTLPFTGGPDPVVFTISDRHDPGTQYFGKLVAIDVAGLRTETNIVTATTQAPATDAVVVWTDSPTSGYSIPSEFTFEDGNGFESPACYAYSRVCSMMNDRCYENLRRQGLAIDISEADFDTAFFEYAVRIEDPDTHSYYSALRIMLGESGSSTLHGFESYTIRADGSYRIYQIPIRILGIDDPLTAADLSRPIYEWGIGGGWPSGATVRVDEVRLRW